MWSFWFCLKPALPFIPIKNACEKSDFMGHTHTETQNHILYGPVAFWQNGPEKNMKK